MRTSLRGRSFHRPKHVGQVLLEPVNVYASPILVGVVWVEVFRASASINADDLSGVIEQCRPARTQDYVAIGEPLSLACPCDDEARGVSQFVICLFKAKELPLGSRSK